MDNNLFLKKQILWIVLLILCIYMQFILNVAVAEKPKAMTIPTPASSPLPSYNDVNNMDVILTEKVQAKLAKDKSLKGQHITASSVKHVIYLQGTVANKQQAQKALCLASSVDGVVGTVSLLTIKFSH